jgi:UDP-N-acetylmuramoyl-tripeptide--D-alanyl-D-alanine ligase
MMLTLSQAAALLPDARLEPPGAGAGGFDRVHTDTRSLRAGDLFVALRGERFDAHDFLPQAWAAGAAAALVERTDAAGGLPCIVVPDTLAALQQLAAAWRQRWHGPLVAVTGSNGKTTVTQMVASIFCAWAGDAALATAGNFNNHIGVPLTLLRLRPLADGGLPAHRVAVLELGMNHAGEIAQLAALARPTVALVNNAQREHQEFMASVEAVARENGSVLAALPADGTAVLPAADAHLPLWQALATRDAPRRVLRFGLLGACPADTEVQAQGRWDAAAGCWMLELYTPGGGADTTLALAGRHNLLNAAAAAACALAAGAPLRAVAQGLAGFTAVAGRSQTLRLRHGSQVITVIDDSYNANPDSVRAAIDVLSSLPGPRWLLLGDMGEVGNQGPQFHAEVGAYARQQGIETFWAAGVQCLQAQPHRHFADTQALLAALAAPGGEALPAAASVLVKGSRFMRMERVVQALQQRWTAPTAGQGA